MTINVILNDLVNLQNENTAVTQINQNSSLIETAFSSALNTTGDQMQGTLDMNSNQIINLPTPATANSPARLQDISTLAGGGTVSNIPSGGNSGQVLTKSGTTNYITVWANAGSTPNVGAGTGLTFSGTTFSITNTGTATGTFGAAASVPVLVVNAQGQITSITTVAASGGASSGAASGTFGATGTTVQVVVSGSGVVTSVTSVSIGIAGSQVISGTISGSLMSSISLGAGNVNGGVNGSLPFTNMVGSDIASLGTVTTGTWSATPITATSLSGTTLANNILVSSLTSLGTIGSLSATSFVLSATTAATTLLGMVSLASPSASLPATGVNWFMIGASGSPFTMANVGYAAQGSYSFFRADGTPTTPTTLAGGDVIGGFTWGGYKGSAWATGVARVVGVVTDTAGWTSSSAGLSIEFDTTPSGSVTRTQAMRVGAGVFVGSATTDPGAGNIQASNAFIMPQYTVTTLPSGVTGMVVMVTDASASTFLGSITGGGTTKTLALYSGATWLDI